MARQRLDAAGWAVLIDQWRECGLSLPAFCQRHGLSRSMKQSRVPQDRDPGTGGIRNWPVRTIKNDHQHPSRIIRKAHDGLRGGGTTNSDASPCEAVL